MPQPWLLVLACLLAVSPSSALRHITDSFHGGLLLEADLLRDAVLNNNRSDVELQGKNRSHAPTLEASGAAGGLPEKIAYMHMTKTGGSFVEKVLQDAAGSDRTILGFVDPWDLQGRRDYLRRFILYLTNIPAFTIGAVRRPCDWYVSLWADLGRQLRRDGLPAGALFAAEPLQNMTDDVARFRKFIRHAFEPAAEGPWQDPKIWPGVMTTQFAWRYSISRRATEYLYQTTKTRKGDPVEYDGYIRPVNNKASAKHVGKFWKALQEFDPSSVNCWLDTTSLEQDLRSCLMKAERMTTAKINWTAFEHAIASRGHNPSPHGECRQYFDQDTENLIRRVDSFIFEKFNYSSCCSPE
mmetsp:Transcript_1040/g.2801  ORF Transcript_1040/g.2801 Transcript_1040/m.2801 type:complete len:354 (+) Transcript_1040:81-1142(+)